MEILARFPLDRVAISRVARGDEECKHVPELAVLRSFWFALWDARLFHFPVPLSITVLPPELGALTVIGKEPAGACPLAIGMNSIFIVSAAPG